MFNVVVFFSYLKFYLFILFYLKTQEFYFKIPTTPSYLLPFYFKFTFSLSAYVSEANWVRLQAFYHHPLHPYANRKDFAGAGINLDELVSGLGDFFSAKQVRFEA
jgi:hypothetical protein